MSTQLYPCKHCGKLYTQKGVGGHTRFCKKNPQREDGKARAAHMRQVRSRMIEEARQEGKPLPTGNQFTTGIQQGHSEDTKQRIRDSSGGWRHTAEARARISEARLKWLRENPEKHPWKRPDKFQSEPCEALKEKLREAGFDFVEEYQPFDDRFFAIDIAFPEAKIGIEVNGNQHYSDIETETLKPYYQRRHDLLVEEGWRMVEVRYNQVYNPSIIDNLQLPSPCSSSG